MFTRLKKKFPACAKALPEAFWQQRDAGLAAAAQRDEFPEQVQRFISATGGDAYLPDLARVELAQQRLESLRWEPPSPGNLVRINPTLTLLEVAWHPLLPLLDGVAIIPEFSPRILAFWRHPQTGEAHRAVARPQDLLALKIVAEQLDPLEVAAATGRPVGTADAALEQAVNLGLLLSPPSGLRRTVADFPIPAQTPEIFLQAEVFTLQWHITHRCDLHCRHCYDRSVRTEVTLDSGLKVLDQLRAFCLKHHVGGQVSFSGGNPFLHPEFLQLYEAARDRNLNLAILGNPVSEERLDQVLQIAKPAFYQVSLEGLQKHNDEIRGEGNFAAVLDFLDLLKRKNIYSMVMLTLTRANMSQVLELAELLRDRVDLFTYNRLAMVGEGACLESPLADEYRTFVQQYLRAKQSNPVLALKDSLINIEREQCDQALFGGCTGFGCGAAFNFVSLLPDGEVHACRKFPSLIGRIQQQTLTEIYASLAAQAYRRGCEACAPCRLRAVCGGCLAAAWGRGVDPFKDKDPACFLPPN